MNTLFPFEDYTTNDWQTKQIEEDKETERFLGLDFQNINERGAKIITWSMQKESEITMANLEYGKSGVSLKCYSPKYGYFCLKRYYGMYTFDFSFLKRNEAVSHLLPKKQFIYLVSHGSCFLARQWFPLTIKQIKETSPMLMEQYNRDKALLMSLMNEEDGSYFSETNVLISHLTPAPQLLWDEVETIKLYLYGREYAPRPKSVPRKPYKSKILAPNFIETSP